MSNSLSWGPFSPYIQDDNLDNFAADDTFENLREIDPYEMIEIIFFYSSMHQSSITVQISTAVQCSANQSVMTPDKRQEDNPSRGLLNRARMKAPGI